MNRLVDMTREKTAASYERSDICVVPAAGVAAEAMVALTLAGLAHEKFGKLPSGSFSRIGRTASSQCSMSDRLFQHWSILWMNGSRVLKTQLSS